jgi:hypothetical protein
MTRQIRFFVFMKICQAYLNDVKNKTKEFIYDAATGFMYLLFIFFVVELYPKITKLLGIEI